MNYQDRNPSTSAGSSPMAPIGTRATVSPQRMRKVMIIAGAVVLVFVALIVGFDLFKNAMMKSFFAANVPPPVTVNYETVATTAVPQGITAIGSIAAVHQVTISPEISGRVTRIAFTPGAAVKKGDVIVQLNDASERAELASARAQAKLAATNLQRSQELFGRGNVSRATLDQNQSQADAADAEVQRISAVIDKKLIRAPFDGVLGVRQTEVGHYLDPGKAIVVITNMNELYVELTVPEQAKPQLVQGQAVDLTVDAYPGRTFKAIIAVIDPQVNISTRTIRIQAWADNSEGLLMPGMFASANITLPAMEGRVTIPETALDYSLYGSSVFLVVDGGKDAKGQPVLKAKRQPVKVGPSVDGRIVIEEGVKPGERIVTTGLTKLYDGASLSLSQTPTLVKPDTVPVQ